MQTDWEGEYQALHPFFTKLEIEHHVSCPYAHQQNGSAERKHRHLVEVGLSLLSHAHIPLKYWDEAFISAAYLINRVPSKTVEHATPLERLYDQQPDYSAMRVFGVPVGLIYGHTMITNSNSGPKDVSLWATVLYIKGTSV